MIQELVGDVGAHIDLLLLQLSDHVIIVGEYSFLVS